MESEKETRVLLATEKPKRTLRAMQLLALLASTSETRLFDGPSRPSNNSVLLHEPNTSREEARRRRQFEKLAAKYDPEVANQFQAGKRWPGGKPQYVELSISGSAANDTTTLQKARVESETSCKVVRPIGESPETQPTISVVGQTFVVDKREESEGSASTLKRKQR